MSTGEKAKYPINEYITNIKSEITSLESDLNNNNKITNLKNDLLVLSSPAVLEININIDELTKTRKSLQSQNLF